MQLFSRHGFVPSRKGSGLLLLSGSGALPDVLAGPLRARFPRLNLFLLGRSDGPEGTVPLPGVPAQPAACRRLLRRTKAKALLLDATLPTDTALLREARACGLPLVRVDPGSGTLRAAVEAPDAHDAALAGTTTDALLDRLAPYLAVKLRTAQDRALLERAGRWLVFESPLAPRFLGRFRTIADLDALAGALGRPRTILCLGNGPSSEEPALLEERPDAILRVNHRWLDRGFLARADCVFTGQRETVRRVGPGVPVVFPTAEHEEDLRFRCATLPGPIPCTSAERLGVLDPGTFGRFRPTNGAVMLAVAVALRPERLIVAGIDLFSHPAGSYPGDPRIPNAYTIGHDRDTELAFMLDTLAGHRGALHLVGDALREAWRARGAAVPPAGDDSQEQQAS
ncbi:MAG: hypothetical protein V2J02_19445 [Pseudomonadales bacterium]|nr:hypothetical protein [Pseudomonadales bacterium]